MKVKIERTLNSIMSEKEFHEKKNWRVKMHNQRIAAIKQANKRNYETR